MPQVMTEQEVLALQTLDEVTRLVPDNFPERMLSVKELEHVFGILRALWRYPADEPTPQYAHVEYSSGLHGSIYINCAPVLFWVNLRKILAAQLIRKIKKSIDVNELSVVVGSDHSAVSLANTISDMLAVDKRGEPLRFDFTMKGENKMQLWKRHHIDPGKKILQIEEQSTTGDTPEAVRAGIRATCPGVVFMPVVIMFDCTGLNFFEGKPIISLAQHVYMTHQADRCPYCKAGSEVVLAVKAADSWDKLIGQV